MPDLIGKEIGAYTLQLLLGSGSSAHVYLGEHKYDRSYAAIKIVHTTTEEWMARWYNENRVLSSLSHPHMLRMLAYGVQDNVPFRITNWASWGTFRDLFTQSLSISDVVTHVKQAASALYYLHSIHLIHRDVKPTNILVEQGGNTLLADFEFAVDYRYCKSTKGPPLYAAPEQKQGYPCPASDQYALGVIVYQWLCGELPFPESSAESGVHQRDVFEKNFPALPPSVGQVLLTALAREPDARFPDIQLFASALEQACQSLSYYTPSQNAVDCHTE